RKLLFLQLNSTTNGIGLQQENNNLFNFFNRLETCYFLRVHQISENSVFVKGKMRGKTLKKHG
ncbi:MAG: hypothetical protein U9N63_07650, partial [Pseudomonadota bacterium]|nr:hypothetical protein [Pseudomonadota bacterium]